MAWFSMPTLENPKSFDALDAGDTATLLCLTRRQLTNLVEQGLPKHGDGKGSYYVWAEVFQWYIAFKIDQARSKGALNGPGSDVQVNGETFNQALTRKTVADADLKELERARERGEVVAVADVEKNISNVAMAVKAKLLALPTKLASSLAALRTKPQIRAALDVEMRQICEELINAGDDDVSIDA